MSLQKNNRTFTGCLLTAAFFLILLLSSSLTGCSKSDGTVLVWTDRAEFAEYAELFNSSHENLKVIIKYQDNISDALPPVQDERAPDVIVGSGFSSTLAEKYFLPLDDLFSQNKLKSDTFYPQLLATGFIAGTQYLLPVSFNLPLVMSSQDTERLISDDYLISIDQIKDISTTFNKKNKSGTYTAMGFAPSWNSDFLYAVSKMKGVNFTYGLDNFIWNTGRLTETVNYLKDWTRTQNTSTQSEQDYQYKYLYTSELKWITEGRCTFAFSTSDTLFRFNEESLSGISFRWLSENGMIYLEDTVRYMGIYKETKRTDDAKEFILWFMDERNQQKMLEWSKNMKLIQRDFGIAGGFSAVKNVNEQSFPLYYPMLMGNIPSADKLKVNINILPAKWDSLKEKVILPYLADAVKTEGQSQEKSLENLYAIWKRQY